MKKTVASEAQVLKLFINCYEDDQIPGHENIRGQELEECRPRQKRMGKAS
jgi:hypothetical protein